MIILLPVTKKAKVKDFYIVKVTTLLILLFLSAITIQAQNTGRITGKVTDKKTGETLIGLTVKLEGTSKGVSTDVDGRYVIGGLASGRYTLLFSYVGYQTKRVSDVVIAAGKAVTLNVIMDEASSQQLQQVVINVSAKQESIGALYAQQKNSAVVSDGIAADVITKTPDKNTSEVLKRVSGTTIQDNKFVIIRGLSDRYNSASIDNGTLPSTEPNRKAFSFDIVPSNLVDNIVIRKAATPDMPADFAGGSVQILTKDIPDASFISFSLGYGYNTQSTFKDFKGSQLSLSSYSGFDNSYNLPSGFPSSSQVSNNISPERSKAALNSIDRNWNVYTNTALPSQNYQLSLAKVKDLKNGARFGAVFSGTYRNSQNQNDVYRDFNVYRDYSDDVYKFSTAVAGLANFAYVKGNTKITFKNLYNHNMDNQFLYRTGFNSSNSNDLRFYAFDLFQKSLLKSTLDGDHKIGAGQSKFHWTAAFSHITNNQPDQRKVSYLRNIQYRNDPEVKFLASIMNVGKENTRMFADLSENIYSGELYYSFPFLIKKQSAVFKAGLSSQYRNRDFNARFLGQILNTYDEDILSRPINTLFANSLVNQGFYSLNEISNGSDRYNAHSLTNAGYMMLDNRIGKELRLVWGVRAEQYNITIKDEDPGSKDVDETQLDILPSANLTYSLNDKTNLRASFFRSLARPEFREMAQMTYYDYEQLGIIYGNSSLKRTSISNIDLKYEYFPANGQILSAGLFYKKFKDAIEPAYYDRNSSPDFTFTNAPEANVYGAELEARSNLDFLGEGLLLKNTSLYANVSFMKSKVHTINVEGAASDRPLAGQSPYSINASIGHSIADRYAFNLLYNRIGRRINRVRGLVFPDIWEDPRDILDFQASVKVAKSRGEIKLNVNDILNQRMVYYYDSDMNKKFSGMGTDLPTNLSNPGTNVSLSFSYTFK